MFEFTLEQDEFDEEYKGLYPHRHMINDRIDGQISYNCSLSNDFKLTLGHNWKTSLVDMKGATQKAIAQHVIRPAKAIPTNHIMAKCTQLLITIHRLWMVLKRVEERRDGRIVGKRIILELM